AALAKTNLGDLSGLVTQLQQSGLGPQVQSWLAGGNVSITPQQIEAALGSDQVKQLAQHFGVDPQAALNLLAQHLPAVVGQSGAAQS
ncbi:MAG: YidB family protein, partial [Roseiarcus sp.]